jgi:hypothetical protein
LFLSTLCSISDIILEISLFTALKKSFNSLFSYLEGFKAFGNYQF